MFKVEILREGILDKTYFLAVFSANSHNSSTCLELRSGVPIFSKKFLHPIQAKLNVGLAAVSSVNPSPDF